MNLVFFFLMHSARIALSFLVQTGHGTMDWLQFGKGVSQGYILSPCLFNLNAEDIIQNARLDEP